MTDPLPKRRVPHWIGTAVFAALLLGAAFVFRSELVAWFTGKSLGGAGGEVATAQAGGFTIKAALDPDPPTAQGNTLLLDIRDANGKPVDGAKLGVVYDMPAMGAMSEMKGNANIQSEGTGRYRAKFDLPMGGTWTLKASVVAASGSASQDFSITVGTKGLTLLRGSGSAPEPSSSSAQQVAAVQYPQAAFDALRSVVDATERVRATLAQDRIAGVAESANTVAQALRAASDATKKDHGELADALMHAASDAQALAKEQSLDGARKAFATLNASVLPLLGADQRLTDGLHVFECPMFEHARWMQRASNAENPYMGTKMLTCGTASSFAPPAAASASSEPMAGGDAVDHYTCSMHPSVKQQTPGKCPICGMDLVPVTKAQQEQGVVMIDEARRQLIGVRTGTVIEAPMRRSFRAVGRVTYDESKLTDVTLKVRGFITKLFVSQTGQRVQKGQPLFQLFSPDLFAAEQDFLLVSQGGTTAPVAAGTPTGRVELLTRAARQRLHLLGLGDAEIDSLQQSGAPSESIPFPSPASGFVIEKDVVEGAAIEAGMRLYRIAQLDKVWVEAEVYEADLAQVRVGQSATVTLDYLPGHAYDAKISYVYPFLDPTARTGRVRVELANKALELRPGMYASVALASGAEPRVQVPASAVVYTGPRRLVFVDLGEGRFRPQEVRVGTESDGMYEVLEGLKAGDRVATSGVFLIAAEARISTAAKYWDKAPEEPESSSDDNAPPMPASSSGAPTSTASNMPMKPTKGMMPMQPTKGMSSMSGPMAPKGPMTAGASSSPAPAATVFTCPMHPEVQSNKPGKCPKCGMDLEPKPQGAPK